MNKLILTLATLSVASFPIALFSEVQTAADLPECKTTLDLILSNTPGDKAVRAARVIDIRQNSVCYAELVALSHTPSRMGFAEFVQNLETKRTDKQAGSSTSGTNLVSKGTAAQALSVAAEYGALTEAVNQQIVTVSGSLGGFAAAIARQGLIPYCPAGDKTQTCLSRGGLDILKRFSYGISFDTSQNAQSVSGMPTGTQTGNAQPVTFMANPHQISAVTGRVILWNARDAVSDAFKAKWTSAVVQLAKTDPLNATGGKLFSSFKSFLETISVLEDPLYVAAARKAIDDLTAATTKEQVAAIWNRWAEVFLETLEKDKPELVQKAAAPFLLDRSGYLIAEDDFVSTLADKPVLTFEYANDRKIGQNPTSTFRLIFDKGIGKKWSLTANGAATVFDTQPQLAGAGRLRDAQFGIQAQRELGTLAFLGAVAISGTYYFQYQASPAILNVTPGTPLPGITFTGLPGTATEVFAEKGNLQIGQIKLVLGPGQSSVRFPLAVTYSNRTELIAKPSWRAQVGISYDFDSLFAK